jgi:hypothetical protein
MVAKMDAMQKDINRLVESNLQIRQMLQIIMEQPHRPHQRQRERVAMNFTTLRHFVEFNAEIKETQQKKKQFGK